MISFSSYMIQYLIKLIRFEVYNNSISDQKTFNKCIQKPLQHLSSDSRVYFLFKESFEPFMVGGSQTNCKMTFLAGVCSQGGCGQTDADCAGILSPGLQPSAFLCNLPLNQMILFGVMPTWSDLLGAGLVLGIVVTIPFENIITNKLCSAPQKEETAQKTLEKGEINEK